MYINVITMQIYTQNLNRARKNIKFLKLDVRN